MPCRRLTPLSGGQPCSKILRTAWRPSKPVVQRLGGSVVDGWLTFGDYDVLVICQLPDNVTATALSMAISAGGAVKSVKTTPLVTFDEGLEALKKAKDAGYKPPPSEVPYFGVYRGA
jgi:uncharacterized protein with GYD domain